MTAGKIPVFPPIRVQSITNRKHYCKQKGGWGDLRHTKGVFGVSLWGGRSKASEIHNVIIDNKCHERQEKDDARFLKSHFDFHRDLPTKDPLVDQKH